MNETGTSGSDRFNLVDYYITWYEKIIPEEIIPDEFKKTVSLPGGKKQIIDSRIPAYRYHQDIGAMVPCPETFLDQKD